MQFRAKEYYLASLERLNQAEMLYLQGTAYALAMYSAGLSVECMLRAFRWRVDAEFEGRHDLRELLKASGVLHVDEAHLRHRGKNEEAIRKASLDFHAAMNDVVVLWHNNLRFASESRLRAHLLGVGKVRGIKGDPVKKNAADLIDAARLIVNRGIPLWQSRTK